jgi:hypothetical protein
MWWHERRSMQSLPMEWRGIARLQSCTSIAASAQDWIGEELACFPLLLCSIGKADLLGGCETPSLLNACVLQRKAGLLGARNRTHTHRRYFLNFFWEQLIRMEKKPAAGTESQ